MWSKISVLCCCKQQWDEIYIVEIVSILSFNANFQIESMFFLLLKKRKLLEFVFILMRLFAKQEKLNHIQQLLVAFFFLFFFAFFLYFDLGKTTKTKECCNSNKFHIYSKQIFFFVENRVRFMMMRESSCSTFSFKWIR